MRRENGAVYVSFTRQYRILQRYNVLAWGCISFVGHPDFRGAILSVAEKGGKKKGLGVSLSAFFWREERKVSPPHHAPTHTTPPPTTRRRRGGQHDAQQQRRQRNRMISLISSAGRGRPVPLRRRYVWVDCWFSETNLHVPRITTGVKTPLTGGRRFVYYCNHYRSFARQVLVETSNR